MTKEKYIYEKEDGFGPIVDDCLDKDSVHYLMVHMTQDEWAERYASLKEGVSFNKNFSFNVIHRERLNPEAPQGDVIV